MLDTIKLLLSKQICVNLSYHDGSGYQVNLSSLNASAWSNGQDLEKAFSAAITMLLINSKKRLESQEKVAGLYKTLEELDIDNLSFEEAVFKLNKEHGLSISVETNETTHEAFVTVSIAGTVRGDQLRWYVNKTGIGHSLKQALKEALASKDTPDQQNFKRYKDAVEVLTPLVTEEMMAEAEKARKKNKAGGWSGDYDAYEDDEDHGIVRDDEGIPDEVMPSPPIA